MIIPKSKLLTTITRFKAIEGHNTDLVVYFTGVLSCSICGYCFTRSRYVYEAIINLLKSEDEKKAHNNKPTN